MSEVVTDPKKLTEYEKSVKHLKAGEKGQLKKQLEELTKARGQPLVAPPHYMATTNKEAKEYKRQMEFQKECMRKQAENKEHKRENEIAEQKRLKEEIMRKIESGELTF